MTVARLDPSHHAVNAYIALGSNLGDRAGHLRCAVARLDEHPEIRVTQMSPIYENPAKTLSDNDIQPAYLNAVIEVQTSLDPQSLLRLCHEIERQAGRDRASKKRWAARPLDLDILVFGKETVRTSVLTIPHPRMNERRFVLQPLVDIKPKVWIPEPHGAFADALLEASPEETALVRTQHELSPTKC